MKGYQRRNFLVIPSIFTCKYARSSNPFVSKIGYEIGQNICGTCPIHRFIRAQRDYTSFLPRKQTARSSLVWKNACVWPDKRRPVGRFNRRVRSVKYCYIPANSSDNPHRSLLPRTTFHSLLFSHPIACNSATSIVPQFKCISIIRKFP